MTNLLRELPGGSAEGVWGLLSHVFATTIAFNLSGDRERHRWTLLCAPEGSRFITTDQPVVNLGSADTPAGEYPAWLDFYYPVSPSRALLVEAGRGSGEMATRHACARDVDGYNGALFAQMHEMAFAQTAVDLASMLNPTAA